MRPAFDHLAVSAGVLNEGAAHVENALGVSLSPGGQHDLMGTHNRLLGLGPEAYLEVIAIDRDMPAPSRPRWFDLDNFDGRTRPTNWIVRVPDLDAALDLAPKGCGVPVQFERGALRWRMAVPDDGVLPFDGAFPALIEWQVEDIPPRLLPDAGCRLEWLEIETPEARELRAALGRLIDDARIRIIGGASKALRAGISTPDGLRVLR